MRGKVRDVFRMQGAILWILGASMIAPLFLGKLYHEPKATAAFLQVILFCLATGLILRFLIKPSDVKFKARDGFLVVTATWIICSLIGAMPFYLSGAIPHFIDCIFESASGFTTTGSTILNEIESLPKSILFWRSYTHWLGGMGIIVFVMALLPAWGISGQMVAFQETPGPTKDKLTAHFTDTARGLYKIYLGMTIAQILLLRIGKISWYDSFIHAFGSMGTGGFSNYNDSIAHFDSAYIQIVIIVFMLLAGINFNLYYLIGKTGIKGIFKDEEASFYLKIVGSFTVLIFLCNAFYDHAHSTGKLLLNSLFQVTAIITTTGFGTDDYNVWPTFSKVLILCLFFFGGCACSTGGGIKCVRVLTSLKLIKRSFSLRLHPTRIYKVSFNKEELSTDTLIRLSNFMLLYGAAILGGTLALSFDNLDFLSTFGAAISCLGNVGPGFNLTGPTGNYSMFSDFGKSVCTFLMIAGRLELFTVFTLFSKYYWNSNRTK